MNSQQISNYPFEVNGKLWGPGGAIAQPQTPVVCSKCGGQISPALDRFTPGYGIDPISQTPVCYACCADLDREVMRKYGAIRLYLTMPPAIATTKPPRRGAKLYRRDPGIKLTNWPGSLGFAPSNHEVQISRHNWGLPRFDVWFVFEGDLWHGFKIGNDTDLCHCKRNKPQPQPKPRPHYVIMGGLHGYMPNFCEVFPTRGQCAEFAGEIHDELSQRALLRLRRDMYLELDLQISGNEYLEISECYCDDPGDHSESGEYDPD